MSPIGSNNSLASVVHGAHQSVDGSHRNVGPGLLDGLLQFCGGGGSWADRVQLPLQHVPKVFNGVHIRAQRGPGHDRDPRLLQEVLCSPGRVWTGIVLLEFEVCMPVEKGHYIGTQHLIDVSLRCDAPTTARGQALKEDRA